jgi:hypothetical protein
MASLEDYVKAQQFLDWGTMFHPPHEPNACMVPTPARPPWADVMLPGGQAHPQGDLFGGTTPIPSDLANCVDPVDLTPEQLQQRQARIEGVIDQVSPEDRVILQSDLENVRGELEGRKHMDNVDAITHETISNASDPHWNGNYGWESKFHTYGNRATHQVVATINIETDASEEVQQGWREAVEAKWSNRMKMDVAPPDGEAGPPEEYAVRVLCRFTKDPSKADYHVDARHPGDNEGGRHGQGGTTGMKGWGVNDKVDITHEFGHMLGNPEEYFTTNGHDYTDGGHKQGYRDPNGGIMNNPANAPLAQNYEQIRESAARSLGIDEGRCTVHE